jgi:hypothetical protein
LHPNVLVLDRCRYALGDGPWSDVVAVWKARQAAWNAAGLQAHAGMQPWALAWKKIQPARALPLKLEFSFASEIDAPLALVVEKAEHFEILVNGEKAPPADGWHWDRAFGKVAIHARKGANRIELQGAYRPGVEVEDVFVLGDFATKKTPPSGYALAAETPPRVGDWIPQGYHFYSGNMSYEFSIKYRKGDRLVLRLKDVQATAARVVVNGRETATLGWRPWEADLTAALRPGGNTVEVVVISSLQNTFGPLHNDQYQTRGYNWWLGPGAFTDQVHWTEAYHHAPYGLGGVELLRWERR